MSVPFDQEMGLTACNNGRLPVSTFLGGPSFLLLCLGIGKGRGLVTSCSLDFIASAS